MNSNVLLQKIVIELSVAYPDKKFIFTNDVITSLTDCFEVTFYACNANQYRVKIGLKKEYINYSAYLEPNKQNSFQSKGENPAKYAKSIIDLIEVQANAFQRILERSISDVKMYQDAVISARTIALAVESLITKDLDTFPVRFATKKDLHCVQVGADNHIKIETFGITLEQALRIIEILQTT
jgi:hypothetical protein